jgi:hypothetical protein
MANSSDLQRSFLLRVTGRPSGQLTIIGVSVQQREERALANVTSRTPAAPGREQFSGEEQEAYDRSVKRLLTFYLGDPADYKPNGYYGALLNSPLLSDAISELALLCRSAGNRPDSHSHADREWVDQVLSKEWGYYGVLGIHTADAVGVGVRLEAIEALWEEREEDLSDDEQLLTRYVRQVASGTVDDPTWESMTERLGDRGLIEYTMFICHLQRVLRLFQAFGIPSPKLDEIKRMNRELREGTRTIPDYATAQRSGATQRSES